MMETERRCHQKHRCKHCGKSFPSGRSLGGHMRCHAPPAAPATTSPASEPDEKPQSGRSLVGGGFPPAYGLRQNPKKTWRISADDVPAHGGGHKSCRECGKRFASWKSLFGHMRSHSLKQLSTIEQEEEEEEEEQQQQQQQQQQQEQEQEQEQEQQSKAEEEEEEEEEASRSRSDTVFGNVHVPRKRRRSRRAIASCSVSASEECEKEDEEGAITLLMLSRDVRCWSGSVGGGGGGGLIHCVQESSDKNSAVVENKRVDLASDEGEETKKAKRTRRSQPDDLRNARRSRGIKKVEESDASDNGLIGDHGFEQFDDSRKDPSSNSASEFWIKGEGSELEASLHGASNGDFDDGILAEKRRRKSRSFECADCDKAFHSYQALGGHRASHHKRIDQKADLIARRGGSGKKAADHECLICGRSFASGQALGGHKKSHLGLIQQQKLPEKQDELLDLNIPASTTEGDCVSTNNGSILSSIYGGLAEAACSMSH